MAFGGYNKRFEPARTDKDWLTRDEKEVDAYLANPWCTFRFTVNAYYHMFCGIEYAQKKENIEKIPKDLPLYLVAGSDDPVGNFGKKCGKMLQKRIGNVELKMYHLSFMRKTAMRY